MAKNENSFVVQGWMVNKLKLSGNALLIYAIIYGATQTKGVEFPASNKYFCNWLNVSKPTVINTIKDLEQKGLRERHQKDVNGMTFNSYVAKIPKEAK